MDKRLFFCGRGPFEEPGAWAKLMNQAEFREYLSNSLFTAGVGSDRAFKTCRVEIHKGTEEDSRIYIWGEDEPGFQADHFGDKEGLVVELDGKVVFDNTVPCEDEDDEEDDEES